jgi:hypothetical protein
VPTSKDNNKKDAPNEACEPHPDEFYVLYANGGAIKKLVPKLDQGSRRSSLMRRRSQLEESNKEIPILENIKND